MQKQLCFALSMTLLCSLANSSPVSLDTLEFDNLDSDLDQLAYEVEEEDLDDFAKLLDNAEDTTKSLSANNKSKTTVNTSGFKKKNTNNKGSNNKHDIQNLKKFYKTAGIHDQGTYDDDDLYAVVEGVAAQATGVKGSEDRKYRKGTKTRGFHRVHHKDEYKKDKVFYEDDETKGTLKKVGAKGLGFKILGGAGFNKGHFHHDHQKGIYGREGIADKGFANRNFKDYSDSQGFDGSFNSAS